MEVSGCTRIVCEVVEADKLTPEFGVRRKEAKADFFVTL